MTENNPSRNSIFFLGAGASAHAGIPTVKPMTEKFLKHLKETAPADCLRVLNDLLSRLSKSHPDPDIEAILQTLHRLTDHKNDPLSAFLKEDHGLDLRCLAEIKNRLEAFIRNEVIRPTSIDYLRPLLDSAWGSPIDIFSVNYDPCVELVCRDLQRRLIDGFTPEWNPRDLVSVDASAVYLYKLHGSVLWYKSKSGWFIKIPIGPNSSPEKSEITLYDGETASPILLYPMYKQPMESPLLDFTYILKQRLESTKFLIVIGYSFRDDYICALFRDAFKAKPDLHMINIGPEARTHFRELVAREPSFQSAFFHRVTCLPFPVERILKDFTANFQNLTAQIKKWQDYRALRMTGRDAYCLDIVEPLSKLGETVLSQYLITEPGVREQLELENALSIAIRNYVMATAMDDPELMAQLWEPIYDTLTAIWRMLHVEVSYANGSWQVRCTLRKTFGTNGVQTLDFYPLYMKSQQLIEEVNRIKQNLLPSARNIRALLENLLPKIIAVSDFFENLSKINSSPLEAFRELIRPQLLETAEKFDGWEHALRNTPGNEAPAMVQRLAQVLHPVHPKAFADLLNEVEKTTKVLAELNSASIKKSPTIKPTASKG